MQTPTTSKALIDLLASELRTPLVTISIHARLLEEELGGTLAASHQAHLREITRAAIQLEDLLELVKLMTRLEAVVDQLGAKGCLPPEHPPAPLA